MDNKEIHVHFDKYDENGFPIEMTEISPVEEDDDEEVADNEFEDEDLTEEDIDGNK